MAARCQDSVLPERVLQRQRLLVLVVVLVSIDVEVALEIVDLVVWLIGHEVPLCMLAKVTRWGSIRLCYGHRLA